MSRFNIVIFGVTGFTGRNALQEAIRIGRKTPLTWAVAGRSQQKLEETLAIVAKNTGEDLSSAVKIIADVSDEESLKVMCSRATVLVNCCGPYMKYGEPVVKACIDARTHYVDVTGEPQFIESMQLRYSSLARDAGVYVVNACGFDSVPNDMGVMFLKQQFDGTLNSVESYLSADLPSELRLKSLIHGSIHYGTWESLVNSLANANQLVELRKQLFPNPGPVLKPKLKTKPILHTFDGDWALPFPGSDQSIVYRTQRALNDLENQRPVQFKPYFNPGGVVNTILITISSIMLLLMSKCGCTRSLLLRFPRLFSFGFVTRADIPDDVMNGTTFQFRLLGRGWPRGADVEAEEPQKTAEVKVRGVNPGYGATVTALLWCAHTILTERDRLPKHGGVYTTGVAFQNTSLIQKLNENNLTFELVKN